MNIVTERIVPAAKLASNLAPPTEASLTGLHLCEHFDTLGVSAVIAADLESRDIIYCSICSLRFHFFTEGNRIIVGKVESV